MSTAIKRMMTFLLPLFIIISLPFILFYYNGEFISNDRILEIQLSGKPMLLGKILTFGNENYSKIEIIKRKKPAVITLGNSRVLQFRSKFFNDDNFYNGGGIGNLTGFREAIDKLNDNEKPKIIILGLEQSYFNPFSDSNEIPDITVNNSNLNALKIYLNSWRSVYFSIFNGKYSVFQLLTRRNDGITRIGMQPNVKNSGIRNDGSYDYGEIYNINDKKNEDYKFKDTLRRMEKGVNLFYHGDKISKISVILLSDFLDYCKVRGIYVIGFLPPYAQEIYDKMKSSGEYKYVLDLEENLRPIFRSHDYDFFNFSDMRSFGAENDEIIDGLHASEKAYLKLFINMVKKDIFLKKYSKNVNSLESMLEYDYKN